MVILEVESKGGLCLAAVVAVVAVVALLMISHNAGNLCSKTRSTWDTAAVEGVLAR